MISSSSSIHAFVVGVSRYNWKGADLEGPVPDALAFAGWLKDKKVDPQNIHLFLSPLAERVEECKAAVLLLGLSYSDATKANIDDFLDHLPSGSMFILFWSGHGVVDKANQRYLFFEDTTERSLNRHFNVNNTFDFLRSKGFPKQIGFIDACAKFVNWDLGDNRRPIERGSAQQSYMFAASPGQAAADNKSQRSSKFSKVLRPILQAQSLPLNPTIVIQELVRAFGEKAEQKPQYFAFKDFESDETVLGHPPESEYINSVADANHIPVKAFRLIANKAASTERLSLIDVRDKLFAELQRQTSVNLARPEKLRLDASDDLLHMIAGAVDRKLVDLMCDLLNALDAESLAARSMLKLLPLLQEATWITRSITVKNAREAFYRTISSPLSITEADSVGWMIWSFADSSRCLELVSTFLVRLASCSHDKLLSEQLRSWASQYLDKSEIEDINQEESENLPTFLFIDIDRRQRGIEETDFVEAFLRQGNKTVRCWYEQESKPEDLGRLIDTITSEAENLVKRFFVQFLVPREMFDWNVHAIVLDGEPLGSYFPVALRWRERVHQKPRTRYQDWIIRSQMLRSQLEGRGACDMKCCWVDKNSNALAPWAETNS